MQWSRAASAGSPDVGFVAGQRHRLVDRQRLGQRAGRPSVRARRRPGSPARRRPGPTSGTGRARPTAASARLRGASPSRCRRAAQARTCCGCTAGSSTPSAAGQRLQPRQRVGDRPAGCARRARRSTRRCSVALRPRASACRVSGQQARQAGAGDLADAHQELGAHVGRIARRVGRAQHQQAEGAVVGASARGAAGSSPSTPPSRRRRASRRPRSRRSAPQ